MKYWGKLLRLRPVDAVLLPGIVVLVIFTRLALSLVPFAWLRKALDGWKVWRFGWLTRERLSLSGQRIPWMVKSAARFVPGATCLTQALVTELLFGFCGQTAETCFGVARENGRLQAHAWVELGGKVILGAAEAGKFTPLFR